MQGAPDKPKIIGERLKSLRVALGYDTAANFARFCGIGETTWNNYEKGKREPDLREISKLRRATGITTDWVYYGVIDGLPHRIIAALDAEPTRPGVPSRT